MAQLESPSFVINYNKDGVKKSWTIPRIAVDLAAGTLAEGRVSVATSATQVTGLPASPGLVILLNTDATNYVDVAHDNTNFGLVRLSPYDSAAPDLSYGIFRLAGTTLWLKANTAACNVLYIVLPIPS